MSPLSTQAQRSVELLVELLLVMFMPLSAAAFTGWGVMMVGTATAPAVLLGVLALVMVMGAWVMRARRERVARLLHNAPPDYPWRQRLAVLVAALLVIIAAAWVGAPAPLTSLDSSALEESFVRDAQLIDEHGKALNLALARLDREQIPPPNDVPLTARQEAVIVDSWRALLDYTVALEGLRRFYEDYYRFDLDRRRDYHLLAFLLTYSADATLYDVGNRFAALMAHNQNARKLLDAPRPGIQAGSFSIFRQQLISYDEQLRYEAGKRYLPMITRFDVADGHRKLATALRAMLERRIDSVAAFAATDRAELGTRAELQALKRGAARLWYPLQKGVAEALGDTRVRRIGHYLIDRPLLDRVDTMLEPGDILLARKNWYLSNVGLPGFWPHAIVYVGTPDKLTSYFDDPEVSAWLKTQAKHDIPFDQYLKVRFPKAYEHYLTMHEPHHQGEAAAPPVVIEAVSEGVVFSTLGECAGDYLAGLRPRLSKLDKAKAIVGSFSQFGKPYDFDFDFATDHALVCTELVYRAFRPEPTKPGIDFTLREIAGRATLPANDIAAQYALERGTDHAQLDFVVFVDAREKLQQAFLSDERAFALTSDRPKWDIVQE